MFRSTARLFCHHHRHLLPVPVPVPASVPVPKFIVSTISINEHLSADLLAIQLSKSHLECLAVVNDERHVVGYVTAHDYVTKALTVPPRKMITVKDICTYSPSNIMVKKDDCLNTYVRKMMSNAGVLFVIDDHDRLVDAVTYKDVLQKMKSNHDEVVMRLSNFAMGKGAYFGSE